MAGAFKAVAPWFAAPARCTCGHARDWHSHDGQGDCEHDINCGCQAFEIAAARPAKYTPEFEIHAAPEAIKAHIEQARARSAEILNEIGWLEGLYLRRLAGDAHSHAHDGDAT